MSDALALRREVARVRAVGAGRLERTCSVWYIAVSRAYGAPPMSAPFLSACSCSVSSDATSASDSAALMSASSKGTGSGIAESGVSIVRARVPSFLREYLNDCEIMWASRLLMPAMRRSSALLLPGNTFSFRCLKICPSRSAKICFFSLRKQLALDRSADDARSSFSLRDAFLMMASASRAMSCGSYFSTQRSAEAVACRSNVPLLILPLDFRLPSFSASFSSALRARASAACLFDCAFFSSPSSSSIRRCSAVASASSWRCSRGARCDGTRSAATGARGMKFWLGSRESGESRRCPYAR